MWGPICIQKLIVFPSVPGPGEGGIKATVAQAGEEEDPPEDMEVDPNPAGKSGDLCVAWKCGLKGPPHVGRALWPWL